MIAISKADLDWYDSKTYSHPQENYNSENIDFKVGDIIVHIAFGSGQVIGINNDILEVVFKAPFGIKSLVKNHKGIKRLKN
jgi:DNA helicase-2/ATP-dependent DNA helicase PcrA